MLLELTLANTFHEGNYGDIFGKRMFSKIELLGKSYSTFTGQYANTLIRCNKRRHVDLKIQTGNIVILAKPICVIFLSTYISFIIFYRPLVLQ